jgi:hypothetical protein
MTIYIEDEIEKIMAAVNKKMPELDQEQSRKVCFDIYWLHMATLRAFGIKLVSKEEENKKWRTKKAQA